jgi:deazaflavin-dependent oxidoreductase (nitroreductase family)
MKEAHVRKIAPVLVAPLAIGTVLFGAATMWRHDRRVGTAFVNSVVNPVLLRRGLAGNGRSEIATLEHVGRRSGMKRLTPVHPGATQQGFRIVVPLGMQSEWARNVIAAGHCRIQLHDQVFDLDEPAMVDAGEAKDLPWPLRRVMAVLGFKYLYLRTFAAHPAAAAHPARLAFMEREAFEANRSGETKKSVVDRDRELAVR